MQFVPGSERLKPRNPRLVTSRHGLKWRFGSNDVKGHCISAGMDCIRVDGRLATVRPLRQADLPLRRRPRHRRRRRARRGWAAGQLLEGRGLPAGGRRPFARNCLCTICFAGHVGNRRWRPLPPTHFSSNEGADAGRIIVVAVDEAHIRRLEGKHALVAATRFIEALPPADRVAVVGLSSADRFTLTRDRVALRRHLESLTGIGDPMTATAQPRA